MFFELLKNRKIRIALISAGAIIAIVILITIINSLNRAGKVKLSVKVEPSSASVFIDNANHNVNNSEVFLEKGKHEIIAFLDQHQIRHDVVELSDDNYTYYRCLNALSATLEQVTECVEKELSTNSSQNIASTQPSSQEFPIIRHLPYYLNEKYAISYQINENPRQLKIEIDMYDNTFLIDNARDKLLGFSQDDDITSYDINFINYDNGLTKNFTDNNSNDPYIYLSNGLGNSNYLEILPGVENSNYFYTLIRQYKNPRQSDQNSYFTNRVILEKVNGAWRLATKIIPILTKFNTSNIPQEILNLANQYTDQEENA